MKSAHFSVSIFSIISLLLLCAVNPGQADTIEAGSRNVPEFEGVELSAVQVVQGNDRTQNIELKALSHADLNEGENILHLDFDANPPVLLKDTTGNFRINEANYSFINDSRSGQGAALFNRKENIVRIHSPEELWPGTRRMHSFSVEMWIKPYHFSWKNSLFLKEGQGNAYRNEPPRKIEIFLQNKKIHFVAQNLFRNMRDELRSLKLISRSQLKKNSWSHILISYNSESGRLSLYLNGREEQTNYAEDRYGTWSARMEKSDRAPIIIGNNYFGIIDEFRVSHLAPLSEAEIRTSRYDSLEFNPINLNGLQQTGYVISDVSKLPKQQINRKARITYDAIEPAGTAINFWIRHSLTPFKRDTPQRQLPWRLIRKEKINIDEFSYFQWKAELRSDPNGLTTPILKDVVLNYTPYQRPVAPRNLQIVEDISVDRQICLDWIRNPETEIGGGGYIVYYGLRPGEYFGRITHRFENREPLPINSVELEKFPLTGNEERELYTRPDLFNKVIANHVRLLVKNDLIEKNIILNRKDRMGSYMPFLKNNQSYYFAITAYYRTESGQIIESPLSEEISYALRPSVYKTANRNQSGN